jgi:hypothetical protein
MKVIKPDSKDQTVEGFTLFLAGSIEMGKAINWQESLSAYLNLNAGLHGTIFNPRRNDWDWSWTQEQKSEQFNYQVNWEMERLNHSDFIFMNILPDTQSPITLLELGLHANSGNLIVCCPKGFWRKGNVDIVCTRYGIPLFDNYEDAVGALLTKIKQHYNYEY